MTTNSFIVDKCTKCNLCVEICPLEIIEKNVEKSDYPFITDDKAQHCIKCGHCEAVCPTNAVIVNDPSLSENLNSTATTTIPAATLSSYFKQRRSIRFFRPEPVEKNVLEQIFDTVRFAPTGVNRQELKWSVLQDPKQVHAIAQEVINWMKQLSRQGSPIAKTLNFTRIIYAWKHGRDPICRNAPHLIVAFAHKNDRAAQFDGTIACSHFELLAPTFATGACWGGYLNIAAGQSDAIRKMLYIPDEHNCNGVLLFGYPSYTYQRIPKRKAAMVEWH